MISNEVLFQLLFDAFPEDKIPSRFRLGVQFIKCFVGIQSLLRRQSRIECRVVVELETPWEIGVTLSEMTLKNLANSDSFRLEFMSGISELNGESCTVAYLTTVLDVVNEVLATDGATVADSQSWVLDSQILELIPPALGAYRHQIVQLHRYSNCNDELNMLERKAASLIMVMSMFTLKDVMLTSDLPAVQTLEFMRSQSNDWVDDDDLEAIETPEEPRPKVKRSVKKDGVDDNEWVSPMHRRSGADLDNPINPILDILVVPTTPEHGSPDWMDEFGRPKLVDPDATKAYGVSRFKSNPVKPEARVEWPE